MRRRTASRTDDEGPLDAGLQVERTSLAWGRTGLAFIVVGALFMHTGRSGTAALGMIPGLAVVACGLALYLLGRGRHARLRAAARAGASVAAPPWLRVVAALASVSALIGLAFVLVTPG